MAIVKQIKAALARPRTIAGERCVVSCGSKNLIQIKDIFTDLPKHCLGTSPIKLVLGSDSFDSGKLAKAEGLTFSASGSIRDRTPSRTGVFGDWEMAGRILVVDDEQAIREMIGFALSRAGFSYVESADTFQAEAEILRAPPDLVLLDWMLPGQSGIEFVRRLRSEPDTRSIPVIMLTARGEEDDKVRGLKYGADDYVTKPFASNELVARIEAVLRRVKLEATNDVLTIDGLRLDPVSHRVTFDDCEVALGPTEFRMLHLLMSHPERVYSRDQLLDLVWGQNIHVGPRTVDMHVSNLRKALEGSGHERLIQTVRGSGYRLSGRSQP